MIQLPAADYPDEVAGPLLEQAAEQAEEFARHGYRLALVGHHAGLQPALDRYGLGDPACDRSARARSDSAPSSPASTPPERTPP